MESPPEIPVVDEHSPAVIKMGGREAGQQQSLLSPDQASSPSGAAASLSLQLQLPPSPAGDRAQRRYSLDEASDSGWEMLSRSGLHSFDLSHGSSSPRSVATCDDAYESDAEAAVAAQAATAAAVAALPDLPAVAEQGQRASEAGAAAAVHQPTTALVVPSTHDPDYQEPALEPFGSLVLDQGLLSAAAAAAAAAGAAPPSEEGQGLMVAGEGSDSGSPRSSFEHASNASRNELYSLSPEGSHGSLSDHDAFIDDMMMMGEPDHQGHHGHHHHDMHAEHEHGMHAAELAGLPPATKPAAASAATALYGPLLPGQLVAGPAATVAAAAHGAYCAASCHLRALAATVGAYLAQIVPATAELAHSAAKRVLRGVADTAEALRSLCGPAVNKAAAGMPPQGLGPLPSLAAMRARVQATVHTANKQLGVKRINWAKVALVLGLTCSGLAIQLYRTNAEKARLAAQLVRREGDLHELLMRIQVLQRNITAHRSVPIIRHASASASCGPSWTAVTII